ncbi:PREDICTED: zinc finger protein 709-like isoform X2 [Papilio xuthus]|uniref:Zinc finger protein 709-like isoform X2 n=1 Tax=Papilio xuthus TaxID=66420 RepID=A0AAJ6Z0G7_PAPXU|nr:PREDICTED: zinc finger protein 709-like isoform X2 [Papilio xuthus]
MLTTETCRICLNKNVPMFTLKNNLEKLYETLTNRYIYSVDKPVLTCFICYARLKRCTKLQQQAIKSHEILEKINDEGNEFIQLIETQKNLDEFQITPIYHLDLEQVNEEIDSKSNINLIPNLVKNEPENGIEEDAMNNEDSAITPGLNFDTFQDRVTDSEDDLPLIAIGSKKTKNTKTIKRRNKDDKDYKVDAKEIELTEEEQRMELKERSCSDNYINSPYKCEKCYKGFVDPHAFSNHMGKHDKSSGPYECTICQLRYTSTRQLRAHVMSAHARRYSCTKCPHRSHTRHQAKDHEKWHNGYTYPCRICGQKFQKPTSFLTHMRKKHSEHVCVKCGDSFVGRHGLLMHISKTHRRQEEKDNTEEAALDRYCSDCNIQFLNVNAWKKHVLTSYKHMRNDSSSCDICGVLLTLENRGLHMRSHMKELRPQVAAEAPATPALTCTQCESQFTSRSRLQAHVRRVHLGLKYDKNVVCEMCGKKFSSRPALPSARAHRREAVRVRAVPCALRTSRSTACTRAYALRRPPIRLPHV